MAASVDTPRKLDGEKASRIVSAMRTSVADRGAAGSTFDHVAREAGVSRGLLHYYFGTKERLLVEVVRRDCDARVAALEDSLAEADSVDAMLEALVSQLQAFVRDGSGAQAVLYEMLSASRHSEEIQSELAELYRQWREHLASVLREKQEQGVVSLTGDPEAVAAMLFAIGDGYGLQLISDPEWDGGPGLEVGVRMVRHLLGGD